MSRYVLQSGARPNNGSQAFDALQLVNGVHQRFPVHLVQVAHQRAQSVPFQELHDPFPARHEQGVKKQIYSVSPTNVVLFPYRYVYSDNLVIKPTRFIDFETKNLWVFIRLFFSSTFVNKTTVFVTCSFSFFDFWTSTRNILCDKMHKWSEGYNIRYCHITFLLRDLIEISEDNPI